MAGRHHLRAFFSWTSFSSSPLYCRCLCLSLARPFPCVAWLLAALRLARQVGKLKGQLALLAVADEDERHAVAAERGRARAAQGEASRLAAAAAALEQVP